ncbi:hypothetical protein BKA66DRAFT_472235 [Pyrenochaeta sp. MPI-SDFR-AT-0127]|nr:hypothetical protein BKA66DRAFT_472235 [Pyrenochaeta sp. MPI-SDFR-AT-0127]
MLTRTCSWIRWQRDSGKQQVDGPKATTSLPSCAWYFVSNTRRNQSWQGGEPKHGHAREEA